MTDAISFNVTAVHITQTPNICGGKPCIAGTRIRVQDIYVWHELGGQSAEEIASQYHLTLAQVYAALTYYFEHIEEIQADIRASEKTVQDMMRRYPSKL
jgi:uncharacterized protein (DUF433 family)